MGERGKEKVREGRKGLRAARRGRTCLAKLRKARIPHTTLWYALCQCLRARNQAALLSSTASGDASARGAVRCASGLSVAAATRRRRGLSRLLRGT